MGKRMSALCATAALLTGAAVTAGAAPAGAQSPVPAPCDAVAYANVSDGYGVFAGTYNLKVAPAMECDNVASVPQNSTFYFWCYVYNEYGNLWAYGRVAGTTTQGWTSMDNIRWDTGTLNACPTEPAATR